MKTKLIKVGDAWCVCLPKALLKGARVGDEVELEVQGSTIIVKPVRQARQGWATAFQAAVACDEEPSEVTPKC